MFRKRADRITGIAGTLEGRRVLVVDAVAGAGPGLIRVSAAAGASVLASASDTATLDVTVAAIKAPPHPIEAMPRPASLGGQAPTGIDDAIINPGPDVTPENAASWTALARELTVNMRDNGRVGSIVFVIGIERSGSAGSVAALLRREMENLAAEVAPNAIRVNAVACGPIGTTRRGQPQSNRATPLGHMTVHPVDVGKAAWFFLNQELSPAATGATLRIDRGAGLTRPDW